MLISAACWHLVHVIMNIYIQFRYHIFIDKPQKVDKKDINCRVFNWETMNCTWKLGVDYIHLKDIKVELVWAVA